MSASPRGDGTSNRERVEASRRLIPEAIGDVEDTTFVRGVGNIGDHLMGGGTRALLAGEAKNLHTVRPGSKM